MGGNNLVDLPAIEWLAQQQKPRIWVTDGRVIPVLGSSLLAAQECADFCRANDINVVRHACNAAEIFRGEKGIYT